MEVDKVDEDRGETLRIKLLVMETWWTALSLSHAQVRGTQIATRSTRAMKIYSRSLFSCKHGFHLDISYKKLRVWPYIGAGLQNLPRERTSRKVARSASQIGPGPS